MIVTYRFDTSDPDQQRDLKLVSMADAMWVTLLELREELRSNAKYNEDKHAAHWFSRLNALTTDHNVDLDI